MMLTHAPNMVLILLIISSSYGGYRQQTMDDRQS